MNLRQVEMFLMVVESGGITRASQRLHVSHTAICRQIKLLEDELGAPLLIRAHQRLRPTPAGQVLLPFAQMIFDQVERATKAVAELVAQGGARSLHVGTGTTMLYFFLPSILTEWRRRFPSIPVLLRMGHSHVLVEELRAGSLDVCIVTVPTDCRGLRVEQLYHEELVAAVARGHPLASRRRVRPEELAKYHLISYPKGTATRTAIDECLSKCGVSLPVALEVENEETAETAVANGKGVTFLTKRRAIRDRLHTLQLAGCRVYRSVVLVSPQKSPEHIGQFMNLCREHAKASQFHNG